MVEGRGVGAGHGTRMSRQIEVSPVGWKAKEVDEERIDQVRCLRKNRYQKPFGGRLETGEWWMEKRAWASQVRLSCSRGWVTAGLGFEEMGPSTAAAAGDPGTTLRRGTGEICKAKRRDGGSD